jgi:hypothetical protein
LADVFGRWSPFSCRSAIRHAARVEFQQVILALVISGLCLSGYLLFIQRHVAPFPHYFVIDAALLLGWRVLYRILRRLGNGRLMPPRNVLSSARARWAYGRNGLENAGLGSYDRLCGR